MTLNEIINSRVFAFYFVIAVLWVMAFKGYLKTGEKDGLYYVGAFSTFHYFGVSVGMYIVLFVIFVSALLPNKHKSNNNENS